MIAPPATGTRASHGEASAVCPLSRSFSGIWKRVLCACAVTQLIAVTTAPANTPESAARPSSQISRNRTSLSRRLNRYAEAVCDCTCNGRLLGMSRKIVQRFRDHDMQKTKT